MKEPNKTWDQKRRRFIKRHKSICEYCNIKKKADELDLHHKRIEIDSILASVKNNARFWEFILDKLEGKFPTRNYNRAIDIPEYVNPDCVVELNNIVREKATYILKDERLRLQKRFSNNSGFLDITKYDKSIPDHFKKIIEEDNTIKSLLRRIDGIVSRY